MQTGRGEGGDREVQVAGGEKAGPERGHLPSTAAMSMDGEDRESGSRGEHATGEPVGGVRQRQGPEVIPHFPV